MCGNCSDVIRVTVQFVYHWSLHVDTALGTAAFGRIARPAERLEAFGESLPDEPEVKAAGYFLAVQVPVSADVIDAELVCSAAACAGCAVVLEDQGPPRGLPVSLRLLLGMPAFPVSHAASLPHIRRSRHKRSSLPRLAETALPGRVDSRVNVWLHDRYRREASESEPNARPAS